MRGPGMAGRQHATRASTAVKTKSTTKAGTPVITIQAASLQQNTEGTDSGAKPTPMIMYRMPARSAQDNQPHAIRILQIVRLLLLLLGAERSTAESLNRYNHRCPRIEQTNET